MHEEGNHINLFEREEQGVNETKGLKDDLDLKFKLCLF